jgi:hypothetical protein
MTTRRKFLLSGAAAFASVPLLQACSDITDSGYVLASQETWRPMQRNLTSIFEQQRELVRYATLAPSSHNTQCWKFKLGDRFISLLPDTLRRCPAVDPDDHHLYVSLGCATENLVQAASAIGFHGDVAFDVQTDQVNVHLTPMRPVSSDLFEAIPHRQCTRAEYDRRLVPPGDLKLLEQAGSGDGVRILLFTAKSQLEQILEYVARGNSAQMADHDFVAELKSWIRFNADEAVAKRDGLFTLASGNPAMPRWLGEPLMSLFFTAQSENDKYAKQVRSSSGIAVFVSAASDKAHWVEAGRCYERFALQATALGMRNAMLNQPVEVAPLRPQFASYLGLNSGRPDLVVRFGYGAEMPRSLRRSFDTVLM